MIQLYEALAKMFENTGTNFNRVSKELYDGGNALQSYKTRDVVMKVDNVAKIAHHCGYELCLVPEQSVPRNAIPISPDQSKPKKDDGVRLGEGTPATADDMIG